MPTPTQSGTIATLRLQQQSGRAMAGHRAIEFTHDRAVSATARHANVFTEVLITHTAVEQDPRKRRLTIEMLNASRSSELSIASVSQALVLNDISSSPPSSVEARICSSRSFSEHC